jgi:hypothetical protein
MKTVQVVGCAILFALSLASCGSNTPVVGTAVSVPGNTTASTTTAVTPVPTPPVVPVTPVPPTPPVVLAPVSGPEFYNTMPVSGSSLIGDCRTLIGPEWMRKYNAVGGVIYAGYYKEKKMFECYVGYENTITRKPMSENTIMAMNSNSKTMTRLLLVEALNSHPQYSMQTKVALLLPAVATLSSDASGITLDDLVMHTSGINNENINLLYPSEQTLGDYVTRMKSYNMNVKTKQPLIYSNANYILAASALEVITGKTYRQLLTERFGPPSQTKIFIDSIDQYSNKALQNGQTSFVASALTVGAGGLSAKPLDFLTAIHSLKLWQSPLSPNVQNYLSWIYDNGCNGAGSESYVVADIEGFSLIVAANTYNWNSIINSWADWGSPLIEKMRTYK